MRRLPNRSPLGRMALLLVLLLLTIGVMVTLESPAPAVEDEDDFVPTEQIRADSAVSFPVDI